MHQLKEIQSPMDSEQEEMEFLHADFMYAKIAKHLLMDRK
jgi:hypothetical protein